MRYGGTLALVASLTASQSASAQPSRDPAGAQALFDEASAALQSDPADWASACRKFVASQALDPSAATLMNIARCQVHVGKLATASSTYTEAFTLNLYSSASDVRRAELAEWITREKDALDGRIPQLRIALPLRPAGLVVVRDGVDVPTSVLGEWLPVDVGRTEVSVTAPGHVAWVRSIDVVEGARQTVEVSLVPLPQKEVEAGAAPDAVRNVPTLLIAGWALVGGAIAMGAAAIGTGIATGIQVARAEDVCVDASCSPGGFAMRSQANALEITAWTLASTAAVAASVGIPFVVVGQRRPTVSLRLAPSWAGLRALF